MPVDFVV